MCCILLFSIHILTINGKVLYSTQVCCDPILILASSAFWKQGGLSQSSNPTCLCFSYWEENISWKISDSFSYAFFYCIDSLFLNAFFVTYADMYTISLLVSRNLSRKLLNTETSYSLLVFCIFEPFHAHEVFFNLNFIKMLIVFWQLFFAVLFDILRSNDCSANDVRIFLHERVWK